MGSSRVVTFSNGTICYDADFYMFGGERTPYVNTCAQNYKFAGMERDPETLNDHTEFRQYASNYGRWLSSDPAGMAASPSNPQSWNMYSYVLNNPANLTDPLGLDTTVGCQVFGEIPNMTFATFGCANANIYSAAYNGPAPTIAYLQAAPFSAVNSFFSGQTGIVGQTYAAPPASVWNNSNPDPGYHGGQTDLDFSNYVQGLIDIWELQVDVDKFMLKLLPNDPDISKALKEAESMVKNFDGWKSFKSPSVPPDSFSKNASAAMTQWKQQLQIWVQQVKTWEVANPGQPLPPWLATPPALPSLSGI